MSRLQGKVAVVTGASKGIGAAIAERLAAEGAAVAVNYSKDQAGADGVVARIRDKGGKAAAIQADVRDGASIARLFAGAAQSLGPVDILVNNAGFATYGAFAELDLDGELRMLQVNIVTLTHLTRLLLPGMLARKRG
ncbi:MAG TPA: oxidoreductase, partial [Solibacterales bacterium]|nr:oxidoreductase [Bryobacterales bacterium]